MDRAIEVRGSPQIFVGLIAADWASRVIVHGVVGEADDYRGRKVPDRAAGRCGDLQLGLDFSQSRSHRRSRAWAQNGRRFYSADRLEVWFNTKVPTGQVPNAQPIVSGPILHLATVENMGRYTFSDPLRDPHVPPGRYKITLFMFHEGCYGWWLRHLLTVE